MRRLQIEYGSLYVCSCTGYVQIAIYCMCNCYGLSAEMVHETDLVQLLQCCFLDKSSRESLSCVEYTDTNSILIAHLVLSVPTLTYVGDSI